MRSATGYQLARAELYSTDAKGKKIPAPTHGWNEMKVSETRAYVNVTHLSGREEEEETAVRLGRAAAFADLLTDEQGRCLQLIEARAEQLEVLLTDEQRDHLCIRGSFRTVERTVLASEVADALAAGWHLVRRNQVSRHIPDGVTADLTKNFPVSLSYHDVAWVMGVSLKKVNAMAASAYRRLRDAETRR